MESVNAISVLPWEIIGYVNGKPVRAIAGGAPDEDEIEDDDGDDEEEEVEIDGEGDTDDDETEDDETEDEKPKPKEAVAKKAPAKAAPAKAAPAKATGKGPNYDLTLSRERAARVQAQKDLKALRLQNETDAEKRDREAEERAEARYKPVAVRAAAKAALLAAKYKKNPESGFRLIDLDLVEIDPLTGDVIGLDEQIATLQLEYAELFTSEGEEKPAPPKRVRPAKIDAGSKPPPVDEPKSSAEKIASMYGQGVA